MGLVVTINGFYIRKVFMLLNKGSFPGQNVIYLVQKTITYGISVINCTFRHFFLSFLSYYRDSWVKFC